MRQFKPGSDTSRRLLLFAALITIGWTLAVVSSLAWNIHQEHQQMRSVIIGEARSMLNKDVAFRRWGTSHGGVYVPITDRTQPNPYLNLPERDVTLASGKRLTLMNPAYMLRQLMQDYSESYGIRGHITSDRLMNPGNAPDAWESSSLASFYQGAKEQMEFNYDGDRPNVRMMRPLFVEKGCLKCHGFQGYKIGELRGGISVTIPIKEARDNYRKNVSGLALTHLVILLSGWAGIGFYIIKEKARIVEGQEFEKALTEAAREYEEDLDAAAKVYERSLEAAAHKNEMILDSAGEGIYGIDLKGDVTFINPAARVMLGLTEKDVIGINSHAAWHYKKPDGTPYPPEDCPFLATLKSGHTQHGDDEVFWRDNGEGFPINYTCTPMLDEGRIVGSVVTFMDISDRKRAEEEISRRVEELEKFSKLTVGRELRIIELKEELERLKGESGTQGTV